MHIDQGAVVTPRLQIVVVDTLQHGGGGVVVPRVAAQSELGQLRPDVFQGAPGLSRCSDLGIVVGGASLEAGQRERGEGTIWRRTSRVRMGAASVVGSTGRSRKSTPTAETGAGKTDRPCMTRCAGLSSSS